MIRNYYIVLLPPCPLAILPSLAMRTQLIRKIVQGSFFAMFFWLLFTTKYPLQTLLPAESWLRIDPLIALSSWIARRSLIIDLLPALALIAITALLGRVFCGWACPLGFLIDISDRYIFHRDRKKPGGRRKSGFLGKLGSHVRLKFYLLFGLLTLSIFGLNFAGLFDPLSLITRSFTIVILPASAYLLNSVIALLRPLFPNRLGMVDLETRFYFLSALTFVIFAGVLALGAISRRYWCRNLCPLGALLGLFSLLSPLTRLTKNVCSKCNICPNECTMASSEDGSKKEECILCLRCASDCPNDYISFKFRLPRLERLLRRKEKVNPVGDSNVQTQIRGVELSRRALLGAFGVSLLSAGIFKAAQARRAHPSRLIRPPGALAEEQFKTACIRCGECMKVCRTNVLHPTLFEAGFEGFLTPRLIPRKKGQTEEGGCPKFCNLCTLVCPTNALKKLTLQEKQQFRLGLANLYHNKCHAWAWNTPCRVCYDYCPYYAIRLEKIDGMHRPIVDYEKCIGCGVCEHVCPIEGSAILIFAQRESRTERTGWKDSSVPP
ncbi:MAG: 4Fe-4S binding protein [Candidatus Poribacteria bacterium]